MQVAPPSGPPQGQPQQQGPDPQQIIQMIQKGFEELGKLLQSAGPNLPPEDMQLFEAAAQATDALIQSLMGPAQGSEGQGGPQQKAPSGPGGPMPSNANAGAQQAGPQGR